MTAALITRDEIPALRDHKPCPLPRPESDSPWWLAEAPVTVGARVLIATRGPQQCSHCPDRHAHPVFHWCGVFSVRGDRAFAWVLTGGPPGHRVFPGDVVALEPARHGLMVLAASADLAEFEKWAQWGHPGNWAGLLKAENPAECNWAAQAAGDDR